MGDDQRPGRRRGAFQRVPPSPAQVEVTGGQRDRSDRRSRQLLAVATVFVALIVLAALRIMLAGHSDETSTPTQGPARAGLVGRTWLDPASNGTIAIYEHAMRIDDGCFAGLRALTVTDSTLVIGGRVGRQGLCGGAPGGPTPPTVHFDRVLSLGRLGWSLTGTQLHLSRSPSESLTLRAAGAAAAVGGHTWALNRVANANGELSGAFGSALFRISPDGALLAADLCTQLIGSATITDTTITFKDVHPTGTCSSATAATQAIDTALSGQVDYELRSNELFIDGQDNTLLIYVLSA